MKAAVMDISDKYCNHFVVNLVVDNLLFLISMIRIIDVITAAMRNEIAPGIHSVGDKICSLLILTFNFSTENFEFYHGQLEL